MSKPYTGKPGKVKTLYGETRQGQNLIRGNSARSKPYTGKPGKVKTLYEETRQGQNLIRGNPARSKPYMGEPGNLMSLMWLDVTWCDLVSLGSLDVIHLTWHHLIQLRSLGTSWLSFSSSVGLMEIKCPAFIQTRTGNQVSHLRALLCGQLEATLSQHDTNMTPTVQLFNSLTV